MGNWQLSEISVIAKDSKTGQQWPIPVDLKRWGGLFWKVDKTYLETHLNWTARHFIDRDGSPRIWHANGQLSFVLIIKDPICEEGPYLFPAPAAMASHPWSFELQLVADDGEGSSQHLTLSEKQLANFTGMLWDIDAIGMKNNMLRPFAKDLLDQRASHPGLFRSGAGMVVFLDSAGQPVLWY